MKEFEEYMPGISVKEMIAMLVRCQNELQDIVTALQERVLQLELQINKNDMGIL